MDTKTYTADELKQLEIQKTGGYRPGYTADSLKRLETEVGLKPGYALYAFDPASGQYQKVTGLLVSADRLRVELRTDDWEGNAGH
jgi:hypothetical protein